MLFALAKHILRAHSEGETAERLADVLLRFLIHIDDAVEPVEQQQLRMPVLVGLAVEVFHPDRVARRIAIGFI